MEPFLTHTLSSIVLASTEVAEEEGGSFLVTPGVGLMIWTLLVFFFTLWVLKKFAFPAITEAIDKRAKVIRESIESAEKQKEESDRLLADYRQRLTVAKREELVEAAKKDIEAETRRALDDIRKEVANLTILATEQVTRRSLDDAAHKELVEEALREVDFSALSGAENN